MSEQRGPFWEEALGQSGAISIGISPWLAFHEHDVSSALAVIAFGLLCVVLCGVLEHRREAR